MQGRCTSKIGLPGLSRLASAILMSTAAAERAGAVGGAFVVDNAEITTLNTCYDISESRPWWKVRLTAIGLTLGMAIFILTSISLVLIGP